MADWLILESTREEIIALEAHIGPEGVEIFRAARAPLLENFAADPEVVATQLKKLTATFAARQTLLVVPREVVVFRQFELPAVPPEELPDLVRFQAATKFSTPVDDLIIDYTPYSPRAEGMGCSVLAGSIDKDLLNRWQTGCELAGLQLVGCTVSSVGLAELVARQVQRTERELPPTLVVYAEESKIELLLLEQGIPLFSSVAHVRLEGQPVGRLLDRELKRALVTLGQAHPGVEIAQAVLCGEQADAENWLEQSFSRKWSRLDLAKFPSDELRISCDSGLVSLPAIGWALAQQSPRIQSLDFLRPRKRPEKQDWSKWKWGAVAAALGLILLMCYGGFRWRLSSLASELADIEGQTKTLQMANSTEQPVLESQGLVVDWNATQQNPVDFLILLKQLTPNTDRLYFRTLNLTPTASDARYKLSGSGQARERTDVDELYELLETNGFRVRPKAINQGNKDPDYPVSFELDADWLRESPKAQPAAT